MDSFLIKCAWPIGKIHGKRNKMLYSFLCKKCRNSLTIFFFHWHFSSVLGHSVFPPLALASSLWFNRFCLSENFTYRVNIPYLLFCRDLPFFEFLSLGILPSEISWWCSLHEARDSCLLDYSPKFLEKCLAIDICWMHAVAYVVTTLKDNLEKMEFWFLGPQLLPGM